ncbi:DUF551 domain-containing protein [Yersinia frederiksenii]|uniref:DUF551 domain-containing protein n=1 Tax=Yersinia frederiksenii TaxID=29484 RepID=UPI000BFE57A3|nr:DUF551 domain-containing protein [Yersinia frederiksenii]ATM86705.1 hypothetical protein CRN74_11805 [Yersinia frederiksenii]
MKELDTFTVEEIEEIISSCQQEIHNTPTSDEMPVSPRELLSLARIALAAKRAEPDYHIVRLERSDAWGAEVVLDAYETELDATKSKSDHGGDIIPVYITPQLNFQAPLGSWINCSDRMPEVDDWVVGWHVEGYCRIVSWQKAYGNYLTRSASHHWQGDNDDAELEGSITHWMPLPTAPERPL